MMLALVLQHSLAKQVMRLWILKNPLGMITTKPIRLTLGYSGASNGKSTF